MLAIRPIAQALLALSLAAAPANALDILPALVGDELEPWSDLEPVVLEFSDHDWFLFLRNDAAEILPPGPGTASVDSGALAGRLSQVWEQP